jgi:hypothetical protein
METIAEVEGEAAHDLYNTYPLRRPTNALTNKLRGFKSASELYRQGDRRLSTKLVPTFAERGCRVVDATDSHGR